MTMPLFDSSDFLLASEKAVIAAAISLGAADIRKWSAREVRLAKGVCALSSQEARSLRELILAGQDPLGDAFSRLRSPELRRHSGATFTPTSIVNAMVSTAAGIEKSPTQIVDPGVGSGRFLCRAGVQFPRSQLLGVDIDPLATIIARANLATLGLKNRSHVFLCDYRAFPLPRIHGRTLFIGNPPYVRHHLLAQKWKHWLTEEAGKLGYHASQLAGLHVYFYLSTVLKSHPGDVGVFITSAEWLDVNYGHLVRDLFLNDLGGQTLTVLEPTIRAFNDAAATAVIATFQAGARPGSIRMKRVCDLSTSTQSGGRAISRERLQLESRWSHFTRRSVPIPSGYVELGELCRVHRGQVTGSNEIWIAGPHSEGLPKSVLFRSVTKAKELLQAGAILKPGFRLKDVIDLPVELSVLQGEELKDVERFLRRIKSAGAHLGYIASTRKAWWSVGLRAPAPILATYMARRTPVFVRNQIEARHINVAHGIYPREPLSATQLDSLARCLSENVRVAQGRTYAGGLTKFEPREMERIPIPIAEVLQSATK